MLNYRTLGDRGRHRYCSDAPARPLQIHIDPVLQRDWLALRRGGVVSCLTRVIGQLNCRLDQRKPTWHFLPMNVSLVLAVWYLCISAMFVYICRKCIYIFKRITSSWRSGIITIRTILDYMRSWARLMDDWRQNVIVSSHWSRIIQ